MYGVKSSRLGHGERVQRDVIYGEHALREVSVFRSVSTLQETINSTQIF